jgi:hypothetical protein
MSIGKTRRVVLYAVDIPPALTHKPPGQLSWPLGECPERQRGRTVNPLATPSQVRVLLLPPTPFSEHITYRTRSSHCQSATDQTRPASSRLIRTAADPRSFT